MLARKQGRILLTASLVAKLVSPREAVYAAPKAFVLSFAKSLRVELADSGVSVTALQPGPTNTNFFHRAGRGRTPLAQEGKWENEPYGVAKAGFNAMMKGEKHVYGAGVGTKISGAVANFVPDTVKASRHEKMAKPRNEP